MTTSGGLGESETAGLTMNIVPRAGRQQPLGPGFVSGFSEGDAVEQLHATNCRRAAPIQPTPLYHVYDVNLAVGGPIVKDKLWYYMSGRVQGSRQNILNIFYNQNAGERERVALRAGFQQAGVLRSRRGRTTRLASRGRRRSRNKSPFSWDEQSVCRKCTGTATFSGSPGATTSPEADGHGEFSPQRVQTARWTIAAHQQAAARGRVRHHVSTSGRVREIDPNPPQSGARRRPNTRGHHPAGAGQRDHLSLAELADNKTDGSNWSAAAQLRHRFAQHEVRLPGQLVEGRPREFVNTRARRTRLPVAPAATARSSPAVRARSRVREPVLQERARRQDSFFVQDQWTVDRLTLQGALRYDHPWS